jgi:hypothetical protein
VRAKCYDRDGKLRHECEDGGWLRLYWVDRDTDTEFVFLSAEVVGDVVVAREESRIEGFRAHIARAAREGDERMRRDREAYYETLRKKAASLTGLDAEEGHARLDAIWQEALEYVAAGYGDDAKVARIALDALKLVPARWYA